ncbi:TolC family protein [Mucilaginibacter flavidus]|uniref:TolC family protein n=1 Tax=Mucilaginibacter flavidus TaxID=2949309 RepID=UPI0020923769|nr:TolC family protein [Mucilaginibacter flavidus]MCO5947116.1 TolC family protein [Mucilaginibacter flavidus]
MKKRIFLCAFFTLITAFAARAQSQQQLTLADCYKQAEQNYPLIKQRGLIAETSEYNIDNIQKGYLPQLSFTGQATYQSTVTQIPIKVPGVNILALSKDHYKAYGEINQVLYTGGELEQQKQLQKTSEAINRQQLEAELYQLKSRINQLFFGVLLLDEQIKQNDLFIKDLQLGLNKAEASIKNGTAFKSTGDIIKADILKNKQRTIELQASRKAYMDMLALFTGTNTTSETVLVKPQPINVSEQINRPELLVYNEQAKNLDVQNKLLSSKTLPRLGLFLQGGVGRPGLDMLSNSLDAYYIGGIRLTWSPSVFYTLKKSRALIDVNRKTLDVQKETFLFNTNLTVKQQDAEIGKYQQLLASDDEIINLRSRVKTTAMAQLENGVINGNDFLSQVNAEDQARQSKILHETQLLMSQYNQQTTTGNQQ